MESKLNLCIDQGNSRTKVALFDSKGKIQKSFIYKQFSSADIERLFSLYPLGDSIISSVANPEPAVVNALHRRSDHCILFDHNTPIPIQNKYDTPQTLGQDRLAAAIGANYLCPNENLLIVDIGSAITYDFVDNTNCYLGGNIAPGIKMRLNVLNQQTVRLPMVELADSQLLPLFGKNTAEAIRAGVIRGITYEVKGYMRALEKQTEHYKTFFTGGNAQYIISNIHRPYSYEKHLVLIGLNQILCFNVNK